MIDKVESASQSSALQMLIEGPESPNLGHLVVDLWNAVEEGTFEVETPTRCVDMSHFSTIEVNRTSGPKVVGQIASQPGPPMVEMNVSWMDDGEKLYSDLDSHARHDSVIALYGDMHVWNVFEPVDYELDASLSVEHEDVQYDCNARIGWRDFAVAGWR